VNKIPNPLLSSNLFTTMSTNTLSKSYDSIIPSEEDENERQSYYSSTRRGSRLSDIINIKDRRRWHKNKRYNDKKGFIWRRMFPEQSLVHQRPPQSCLHRPQASRQISLTDSTTDTGDGNPDRKASPMFQVTVPIEKCMQSINSGHNNNLHIQPATNPVQLEEEHPMNMHPESSSPSPSLSLQDQETASLRSDNSFQTATSDPDLNLLPAKITDCYSVITAIPGPETQSKINGSLVHNQHY